ncbi:hypothetical protein CDD83_8562 [Cordyceps sp. RAO-2017]|nr:hypothetical protein CDD83_8562 [Cordyceps sp. RAO-2017]
MAGGRLHASFSAGPISAWFDAFANFLINYKPFHFTASAGICVGASFEIDFLFIHIRISVELSADLYLWGPPFGGQVEVDLKVATIHINFGDAIGDEPPASLLEFYQLVLQASSQQQKQQQQQAQAAAPAPGAAVESGQPTSTQAGTQPPGEGHVFLAQSGLMNSSNNPERAQEQDWTVRGGTFSFVIGCKMAIASATLLDEDGKTLTSVTYGDERIYAKPMHLETPLQSTLAVKILQDGVTEDESQWGMDKVLKAVPTGLWAIYDVNADPSSGGGGHNNIDSLLSPSSSSVTLMMGTVLTAPPPVMSQDRLPVFDIADATLVEIDGDPLPAGQPSQETWTPDAPAEGTGQWAAVHDKWKSPSWDAAGQGGDGVQSQFVKTWAQTLGWDAALAALAGLPKLLDGRFNEIYVAAPLMTG